MPARWFTPLAVCCSLAGLPGQSLFDSWCERADTLSIRLDTDFKSLQRNRRQKAYQSLTLHVDGQSFPGRIRSRGHVRLEVCHLPSLKIKLNKKALRRAGFSDLNDLKLVLPCSDDRRGRGYLRRERLAYAMYQRINPFYHRTLPVRLVIDGGDPLPGFLVEAEEQLAARYTATVVEDRSISTRGLDRAAYLDLCLFNYLILNTDWNIHHQHNVEFIAPEGERRLIPLPYDFDYSGWVGTSYAIPDERRGIASIYVPKFLGRHVTETELLAAAQRWIPLGDTLRELVQQHPDLHESTRKRLLKRLDDFYGILGDRRSLLELGQLD
jgi:hypothetical protein